MACYNGRAYAGLKEAKLYSKTSHDLLSKCWRVRCDTAVRLIKLYKYIIKRFQLNESPQLFALIKLFEVILGK